MTTIIGSPSDNNEAMKNIVRRVQVFDENIRHPIDFRAVILDELKEGQMILDCGKSARDIYEPLSQKVKKIETLDINIFEDYPTIQMDLCEELSDKDLKDAGLFERYDAIICLAVLEHVYDPFKATHNLMRMLKKGGVLYGYVPYLYRYHAPKSLSFQDYFRFSRDSLAYLFRDAQEVSLWPVRGRITSAMHIFFPKWKMFEKYLKLSFLDRIYWRLYHNLQTSGYNFKVLKKSK